MRAKMRDNLIVRYRQILPGELEAAENSDSVIQFLKSIEGKEVDLVFTAGDAFEREDDNIWLPDELWEEL